MIYADVNIEARIRDGSLVIDPFNPQRLQGNSYDVSLGREFKGHYIDSSRDPRVLRPAWRKLPDLWVREGNDIFIPSLTLVLGHTIEYVKLPSDLCMFVMGKSTLGRWGLQIHNAGWAESGFKGQITLELFNMAGLPMNLEAGMLIAQLVFVAAASHARRPYGHKELGSRYQGQMGATGPRPKNP